MNYIFSKDYLNVDKYIDFLYNEGYSLVNQILLLHNFIINSNLNNLQKSNILYKISLIDQDLIKGSNEYIQFFKIAYYIMISI